MNTAAIYYKTFERKRRPLSTAYRTVLYAVDKGLRGRNVLQSLLLILLRICSRSVRPTPFLSRSVIRSDDKELAIARYTNEFEGTSTLLQRIEVTGKWRIYSTISPLQETSQQSTPVFSSSGKLCHALVRRTKRGYSNLSCACGK